MLRIKLKIFFLVLTLIACQQASQPLKPETPKPKAAPSVPTQTNIRWSDPAAWPGGKLPQAGEVVTIPTGTAMLLDISPPPLAGLMIQGSLVLDQRDLKLHTNWIMLSGRLEIGVAGRPYTQQAEIRLTKATELSPTHVQANQLHNRNNHQHHGHHHQHQDQLQAQQNTHQAAIMIESGGVLSVHGEARRSWLRLAQTAAAGATEIVLEESADWRVGDVIVISSTDFDFAQAEMRTLTAVDGRRLSFAEPLAYEHWGELQTYGDKVLDARAEVALLSRNIRFEGDPASAETGLGGHLMVMPGGQAYIQDAEFYRMGQSGVMGHYPIHFHLLRDGGRGLYVKNSSIHHSFSRCITIHGTHGVLVERTVAFEVQGHCFFLEDGLEQDNVLRDNLAITVRKADKPLLPTDHQFPGPAAFWITNPANDLSGNVAAGSEGTGFWYALPQHPTGESHTDKVWPRFSKMGLFKDNVAHSNAVDGLHVDRGPLTNPQDGVEPVFYDPREDATAVVWEYGRWRNTSAAAKAVFEDFTAHKNRHNGVWLRGQNHELRGAILADNAIGVTFASQDSFATDSLFIGESANKGTPDRWMVNQGRIGPDGRSLPKPWLPEFVIRGFEFYDGTVGVANSHFVAYTANTQREAAALSYLDFTNFSVSPANYARQLSFSSDTKPVYLASRSLPDDPKHGEDGYRSAVFIDEDGSVTGQTGSSVVVSNPFLISPDCSYRSNWNAYVCPQAYATLILNNLDSNQAIGPVMLSREAYQHSMLGSPNTGNTHFRTNLLPGYHYHYSFARDLGQHSRVRLEHLPDTEALFVSLPFSGSAFIYRDYWIDSRNLLRSVGSLQALAESSGDAYFHDGITLHLKLQRQSGRDYAALDICRRAGCS